VSLLALSSLKGVAFMALVTYTLARGQDKQDVVVGVGSSISTNAVVLTVDTTNAGAKVEVVKLLENIIGRILEGTYQ
jgi:hypothetical protein